MILSLPDSQISSILFHSFSSNIFIWLSAIGKRGKFSFYFICVCLLLFQILAVEICLLVSLLYPVFICFSAYIFYINIRKMLDCGQKLDLCHSCQKNNTLIKKYEELISLYRKKQAKLSFSISRNSNIPTSSNTLQTYSSENCCKKLVDVLATLMKKRCGSFFRLSLKKSAKKFIFLNLCNRMSRFAKASAFANLKSVAKYRKQMEKTQQSEKTNSESNLVQRLKQIIEFPVIQCLITENKELSEDAKQFENKMIETLKQIKNQSKSNMDDNKIFQRRYMQLEITNKKLKLQNELLKKSLEYQINRAAKETQKKEENWAMFAEEMSQKNQQIQQLKLALKEYEQAHPPTGNVLETEIVSMRREIDDYEKLNKRLNDDLAKVKQQSLQLTKKLKLHEQKRQEFQSQNALLKKSNFQTHSKLAELQSKTAQYSKLIKLIQKKLKRLNIYERQLLHDKSAKQKNESGFVMQELKSQIILMFLSNLSDANYQLHSQSLFDQQQRQMLNSHKETWIAYEKQIREKAKGHHNKQQMFEISEIIPKDENQMISVFEPMEMPSQINHGYGDANNRKEGSTMRMIQLQLQIKKQVQKISQLKEQFLHIRMVVLKLIKSFELQQPLNQSSTDIMRVVFDIFEYSEEERESIFLKKKKIFGFI